MQDHLYASDSGLAHILPVVRYRHLFMIYIGAEFQNGFMLKLYFRVQRPDCFESIYTVSPELTRMFETSLSSRPGSPEFCNLPATSHTPDVTNTVLFLQRMCLEIRPCIPPLVNESSPLRPELQRLSLCFWNVRPNWKQSGDFTTALSVSRVLPPWRPSALDLDFLLLLSVSPSLSPPSWEGLIGGSLHTWLGWPLGLWYLSTFSFLLVCLCRCWESDSGATGIETPIRILQAATQLTSTLLPSLS